jgi:type I restriction enzyme S subunit
MPRAEWSQLSKSEWQIPANIQEQKEIASILSSLDDKIELNLHMNQTLEAMAQAIFKEWFVHFIFPGFDGELVDGLPKGWRKEPIDKSIEFLNGLALQKFPPQSETDFLPVIKIRELRQGVTDSSDKASLEIPEQFIIVDGDILFSWSGSLEVVLWCDGKGALNQHLFKVSSKHFPKWFYYLWTKHYLPIYQSIASDKATTMGHIQRRHLTETIINVPNSDVMELADSILSPIIQKLEQNKIQIKNLTQIRDSLLPKLMTGKIEIQA